MGAGDGWRSPNTCLCCGMCRVCIAGVVEGVAKPLAAAVVCSRQMEGPQPQPVMLFAGHSLSCSAAACVRGLASIGHSGICGCVLTLSHANRCGRVRVSASAARRMSCCLHVLFPCFRVFRVGAATDGSECPVVQCSSSVFCCVGALRRAPRVAAVCRVLTGKCIAEGRRRPWHLVLPCQPGPTCSPTLRHPSRARE